MASNTGPDINTYQIPEVELGDTFNTWRDITNTAIYKLNKIRVYEATGGTDFTPILSPGGSFSYYLAPNIQEGHTFLENIVFSKGVTFNGDVTFNAQTFTVNANNVTIDDYNLILGATAGTNDTPISVAGGGGIQISRGASGPTAEWVWNPVSIKGVTGVWRANTTIGLSGPTSGIYPDSGRELEVYGRGIRISGPNTTDFGIGISLATSPANTSGRTMEFYRFAPSGGTAFADVTTVTNIGATYPFFNIRDGANRKTIVQTAHGFVVGNPVYKTSTAYAKAQANTEVASEVIGVVSRVYSSSVYEITFIGEVSIDTPSAVVEGSPAAFTVGSTYYLSPYTPGKLQSNQPTAAGQIHKAVFIATGPKSVVVMPFTGGLLAAPINTATSTLNSVRIFQYHRLRKGDFVRFRNISGGITLQYETSTAGTTAQQNHPIGIYFKAQANTPQEGEVLGMVIDFGGQTGGASGPYQWFDMMVDGFYNIGTNLIDSSGTVLVAGSSYFLNANCAGTVNSGESTTSCINPSPPSFGGSVNKPLLTATASGGGAGVLHSFRGTEVGAVTVSGSSADITRLVITDLRDGVSGDLQIGHYDATLNGREAIRVCMGGNDSGGLTGNVGVWGKSNTTVGTWTTTVGDNSGNRVLAALDVMGTVRAGITDGGTTIRGCDVLIVRGDGAEANTLPIEARTSIGKEYTTGNLLLNYGVRGGCGDNNYYNSMGSVVSLPRSSLVVGVNYATDPAQGELRFLTSPDTSPAAGAQVTTLTEAFRVTGLTAYTKGMVVGTVGTPNNASVLQVSRGTGNAGLVLSVGQNDSPYGLGLSTINNLSATTVIANSNYDSSGVLLGFQSATNQINGSGFTAGLGVFPSNAPNARAGTWIAGPIWQGNIADSRFISNYDSSGTGIRRFMIKSNAIVDWAPSYSAGQWLRIASGQGNAYARITVNARRSSYHQTLVMDVSNHYGQGSFINVVSNSAYNEDLISGVRIVQQNYAAASPEVYAARVVEIRLAYPDAVITISVENSSPDGFYLDQTTAGPGGITVDAVRNFLQPAGLGSTDGSRGAYGYGGAIAFSAHRSSATSQTASGIWKCDAVAINAGGGFSGGSGIFTAPQRGVYHFNVWALINRPATSSYFYWSWFHNSTHINSNRIAHSENTSASAYETLASTIVYPLNAGDTFFPQLTLSNASSHASGAYNNFSGFMIR
jgi:hypothetical protein